MMMAVMVFICREIENLVCECHIWLNLKCTIKVNKIKHPPKLSHSRNVVNVVSFFYMYAPSFEIKAKIGSYY